MWIGGVRVVILDEENRVLMLRQRHEDRDIWMVPGGNIEDGENAEQAGIREVKEETGLDVKMKRLLWHVEEVSEERGQRFVNFFLGSIQGGVLDLGADPEREPGEQVMKEVRFMSRQEVEKIEVLYPEYLKDELWYLIEQRPETYNVFKLRRKKNEAG